MPKSFGDGQDEDDDEDDGEESKKASNKKKKKKKKDDIVVVDVDEDGDEEKAVDPYADKFVGDRPEFVVDEPLVLQNKTAQEIFDERQAQRLLNKKDAADAENLTEKFANTPWLPPTVGEALNARSKKLYKFGDAYLSFTNVCSAVDLGVGAALYFQVILFVCIILYYFFDKSSFLLSLSLSLSHTHTHTHTYIYIYSLT